MPLLRRGKRRAGAAPPTLTDNFNRANSATSAGPNWVNRFNTVGVLSNEAYPVTSDYCWATHVTPLGTNDMEVGVTVGTKVGAGSNIAISLGFDTSGTGAIVEFSNGANVIVYTYATSFNPNTGTGQGTFGGGTTYVTGDVLKFRRQGNLYTALVNGVSTACTWTDTGNLIPRDASHRIVGFYTRDVAGAHWNINDWYATQL